MRIREARKQVGMTQAELAEKLGVNRATLSKYENGQIELSVSQLKRIAKAIGCEFYTLIYENENDALYGGNTDNLHGVDFVAAVEARDEVIEKRNQRKILNFVRSIDAKDIIFTFEVLNETGRKKVADYAMDLAGNKRYQRTQDESSHESTSESSDSETPPEGE